MQNKEVLPLLVSVIRDEQLKNTAKVSRLPDSKRRERLLGLILKNKVKDRFDED